MIECTFDKAGKKLTCVFSGRMDTVSSSEAEAKLSEELLEALPDSQDGATPDGDAIEVAFDLAGVDYIASSFIRICIATARRPAVGGFVIVNTNALVKKTFKIAGLDDTLNVS